MAFPVARSGPSQWTVTLWSPDGTGMLCVQGTLTARLEAAGAPLRERGRREGPGAGAVLVDPDRQAGSRRSAPCGREKGAGGRELGQLPQRPACGGGRAGRAEAPANSSLWRTGQPAQDGDGVLDGLV